MSTNRRLVLVAFLTLLFASYGAKAQTPTVTVFAAASLTDAMKQVADTYKTKSGVSITLSFGASSTLAQQIDQGAGADVFMSADSEWMDFLQKNGRIVHYSA